MQRPNQLGKVLIAFLGLFLAFFMTVEAAHSHSNGLGDATASVHCQLCATAHVSVISQPSWLTGFILHLIGTVSIGEPAQGSRTVVFTAFIRPPPVQTAFA